MHESEIAPQPVEMEGAHDVTIQVLISDADGAPNFAMRRFVVAPGGWSPLHKHAHEHEVFVLSGEGTLVFEGQEYPIRPGSFAYIDPFAEHQLRNNSDSDLIFLCIVPNARSTS